MSCCYKVARRQGGRRVAAAARASPTRRSKAKAAAETDRLEHFCESQCSLQLQGERTCEEGSGKASAHISGIGGGLGSQQFSHISAIFRTFFLGLSWLVCPHCTHWEAKSMPDLGDGTPTGWQRRHLGTARAAGACKHSLLPCSTPHTATTTAEYDGGASKRMHTLWQPPTATAAPCRPPPSHHLPSSCGSSPRGGAGGRSTWRAGRQAGRRVGCRRRSAGVKQAVVGASSCPSYAAISRAASCLLPRTAAACAESAESAGHRGASFSDGGWVLRVQGTGMGR